MQQEPSRRQLRVGETVRKALSDCFIRGQVHDLNLREVPLTVSEVRMSKDLRTARVYVLPLGGRDQETVIAALRRAQGELRHCLSRQVHLKYMPALHFELDKTFDATSPAGEGARPTV